MRKNNENFEVILKYFLINYLRNSVVESSFSGSVCTYFKEIIMEHFSEIFEYIYENEEDFRKIVNNFWGNVKKF